MRARLFLAALAVVAVAACQSSTGPAPTAPAHDETAPVPPDTSKRGGPYVGGGS